jgi:hypothetical protein
MKEGSLSRLTKKVIKKGDDGRPPDFLQRYRKEVGERKVSKGRGERVDCGVLGIGTA